MLKVGKEQVLLKSLHWKKTILTY